MTHLGVDGCPEGWIVAEAPDIRTTPRFWIAEDFAALLESATVPGRITCIDVPIGLRDDREHRACDVEARRMLGARACCVFTPPCRAALAGVAPVEMRALNVSRTGRSLSAQALGIVRKMREVDLAMTPDLQSRVKEVHPEVVFAGLAGRYLAEKKTSREGWSARLALLPAAFRRAAPTRESRPYPFSKVHLDDYVDALAGLFVAIRLEHGLARRLPSSLEEHDERGLAMEIWY